MSVGVLVCELLLAAPPYTTAKQIMYSLGELSCCSTSTHNGDNFAQLQAVCAQDAHCCSAVHVTGGLKCTAVPELRHTPHSFRVALQSAGKCKSTHPPYAHHNFVVFIIEKAGYSSFPILKLFAL
jgi:hypothetical protein